MDMNDWMIYKSKVEILMFADRYKNHGVETVIVSSDNENLSMIISGYIHSCDKGFSVIRDIHDLIYSYCDDEYVHCFMNDRGLHFRIPVQDILNDMELVQELDENAMIY